TLYHRPSIMHLSSHIRPPPISPLFPYTTLFRSRRLPHVVLRIRDRGDRQQPRRRGPRRVLYARGRRPPHDPPGRGHEEAFFLERSEEHTSELQSRVDLVCRLLLEKKKSDISIVH